jgi:hypothetical protein
MDKEIEKDQYQKWIEYIDGIETRIEMGYAPNAPAEIQLVAASALVDIAKSLHALVQHKISSDYENPF